MVCLRIYARKGLQLVEGRVLRLRFAGAFAFVQAPMHSINESSES